MKIDRKNLRSVLLWVVLTAVAIITLNRIAEQRSEAKRIGIGEFISRVKSGDVTEATISGTTVTGKSAAGEKIAAVADVSREELTRALIERKVPFKEEVERANPWISFIMNLLMYGLLALPVVLLLLMMSGRLGQMGGKANSFAASKAEIVRPQDVKTTFADVAGCEEAVEELREVVDFLKNPADFLRLGARVPKGVLLVGAPGTGKTLLARAVAGEANVTFFAIKASEFVEMFVGVGAARVRDLFEKARKEAPCVMFIDEVEAAAKSRSGISGLGGHEERDQTLTQILAEMDGFKPNEGIVVIAATNRPEVLDAGFVRPGRFDRRVVVLKPDLKGREAILKVHARNKPLDAGVDLSLVARATSGLAGADLENILNEAALRAGKLKKSQIGKAEIDYALWKTQAGPERKGSVQPEREKRQIAVHEAGHTFEAWFNPDADPVNKVTVMQRGPALGLTHLLPLEDRRLHTVSYMLADIKVLLAGRAAEEIVLEDVSSGAANDLQRATELARRMACEFSMLPALGMRTYGKRTGGFLGPDYGEKDYSEKSAALIDREIGKLLADNYAAVKREIEEGLDKLQRLSEELYERETLEAEDIQKIIGPPAPRAGQQPA